MVSIRKRNSFQTYQWAHTFTNKTYMSKAEAAAGSLFERNVYVSCYFFLSILLNDFVLLFEQGEERTTVLYSHTSDWPDFSFQLYFLQSVLFTLISVCFSRTFC